MWRVTRHRQTLYLNRCQPLLSQPFSALDSKIQYPAIRLGDDGSMKYVEVSKVEILSNCRMHMRDLLQLGLDVPHHHRHISRLPPQLLPRGDCIMGLIGPFKVIILHDHALFFSYERGTVKSAIDRLHKLIENRSKLKILEELPHLVQNRLKTSKMAKNATTDSNRQESQLTPFELVVVEHILVELCAAYQRRMVLFQPVVSRLLLGLTHGSENDAMEGLHRLVPIKTGIGNFQMVIDEAVECLEHLLDNDEDLLGLLLSEKKLRLDRGDNTPLEGSLHNQVEVLVEAYHRRLVLIKHQIRFLMQRVGSTQEITSIRMDVSRNRIIRTSLHLTIASVSLAVMTTMAGFLGMNLEIPFFIDGGFTSGGGGGEEGVGVGGAPFLIATGTALTLGGAIYGFGLAHASGVLRRLNKNGVQDVDEVVALSRIFEDMSSIEHAVHKHLQMDDDTQTLTKEYFSEFLAKETSRDVTPREIELIFEVFDVTRDGRIGGNEIAEASKIAFRQSGIEDQYYGGLPTTETSETHFKK